MKMIVDPGGKSMEVLSPYDGRWYKKGVEYEIDFSLAMRMKRDKSFHVELPYQKFKYEPDTWKVRKEAAFISEIDPISGWGNVSTNLIKYSPRIKFSQIGTRWGVTEPLVNLAARRSVEESGAAIWHDQPKAEWIMSPFGRNIAITPFETTQVPPSWVARLNSMDAVFVPCKQNVEMMRDSSVTVPVELIHWGVDTEAFHKVERKDNRPFTFGHMGALSVRKGTDILVKAFQAAFPKEKDVRLICKTSNKHFPFWMKDEHRIVVNMNQLSQQDMMSDFFADIDCFVYPTRGEGFGLTIPEAMATGVPAIATGWSGPMEYMKPEVGWTIDYTMDLATEFSEKVYQEPCGQWATPNFEHLVYLMRYAYEHRDEVKEKGDAAAEYIKREWSWQAQIPLFHEALDKHL